MNESEKRVQITNIRVRKTSKQNKLKKIAMNDSCANIKEKYSEAQSKYYSLPIILYFTSNAKKFTIVLRYTLRQEKHEIFGVGRRKKDDKSQRL